MAARRVALDALARIEDDGAYANLVLPAVLGRSGLSSEDRGLVTDLVYGTTRMRRACDAAVEPYLMREPDPATRRALRVGTYQLLFRGVPAHAAVGATVGAVPQRTRGFVNAVLRKVAAAGAPVWASDAERLSYPDWIVDRLRADLGERDALEALAAMDEPPEVTVRADGYTQDLASTWVADAVGAVAGERVVDLCAAPGGKATALAATGADVVAVELHPARARLLAANLARHRGGGSGADGGRSAVVVADGAHPPLRAACADRVLVDAPCSGLGALRHRPDARWRIEAEAVDRLAEVQRGLVRAALDLVRPGGTVVYSVCTLTEAETVGVDHWLARAHPEVEVDPPPEGIWRPRGRGAQVLPQQAGTDGMFTLRVRRPSAD